MPRKQTLMYLAIAILFIVAIMCMNRGMPTVQGTSLYKAKPRRKMGYKAPETAAAPAAPAEVPANGVVGVDIDEVQYAPSNLEGSEPIMQNSCAAAGGVGLASSLLPREAASSDNFGEFGPDEILKGQSFLSPRDQVGVPETIGGNIRNANQQIRAEPPAPKKAYVWHNSTIMPDTMQRPLV